MTPKQFILFSLVSMIVLLTGCESMQESLNLKRPSARLTGLKFEEVKLDSATLLFDVEIDNHYPVALPLTNFDYNLSTGSNKFLSGNAISQTTVPAKNKKTISIFLRQLGQHIFSQDDERPRSLSLKQKTIWMKRLGEVETGAKAYNISSPLLLESLFYKMRKDI